LDFRILGPVEVFAEGQPLALGGQRQRALLAYLLLHANGVVAGERLLDELWFEIPGGGLAALQTQVSRLRRILGDRIVTTGSGYSIRLEQGELDLDRFRSLLADAGAAADASERSLQLRAADALWRGAPLAGLDVPFAAAEAAGLDELRLAALEDRIEADLELGHDGECASELSGLIARHPLRERLRAQLILALYRSGRQADALEAYRQTRQMLDDELGLEPEPCAARARARHPATRPGARTRFAPSGRVAVEPWPPEPFEGAARPGRIGRARLSRSVGGRADKRRRNERCGADTNRTSHYRKGHNRRGRTTDTTRTDHGEASCTHPDRHTREASARRRSDFAETRDVADDHVDAAGTASKARGHTCRGNDGQDDDATDTGSYADKAGREAGHDL
jgi:DNA-binding SARP family transcriptional activator